MRAGRVNEFHPRFANLGAHTDTHEHVRLAEFRPSACIFGNQIFHCIASHCKREP